MNSGMMELYQTANFPYEITQVIACVLELHSILADSVKSRELRLSLTHSG
jgi:hypothetical protein